MRILTGPIQFWAPDDAGGGGGGDAAVATPPAKTEQAPATTQQQKAPDVSRPEQKVEGEKAPDFSTLKLKTPQKPPREEAAGAPETVKTDKGAGEPEKLAIVAPEKKAEPSKEASKTPEDPKKPVTEPKEPVQAKKPDEKPTLLTPEQIEALHPRQGASEQDQKSFKDMKGLLQTSTRTAKAVSAELETARKELETLKSQIGKLPEEVEKELTDHRSFRAAFDAENTPEFQEEIKGKIEGAEKGLYDTLTKFGAAVKSDGKTSLLDEIQAFAKDNDVTSWPRWGEIIDLLKNPLDRQELINAITARRDANSYRETKLKSVYTNREQFLKQQEEKTKTERSEWAKHVENKSIELAAPHDWILPRDVPQGISEDEKKAIDEHNKAAQEHSTSWQKNVIAAYNRDPDKTAELALKAVQADVLHKENEKLQSELEATKARNKELEQRIAQIKGAGRIAHIETPTTEGARKTTEEEGKIGGDGEAAIRKFNWGSRRT